MAKKMAKKTPNSIADIQTFFEYLKRLNPATFQHVTPEFIADAVANFDADQKAFEEATAKAEKIRLDAIAENQKERDDAQNQIRLHAQQRIDAARARVKAEEEQIARDAAERNKQAESETDTSVVSDEILDNLK